MTNEQYARQALLVVSNFIDACIETGNSDIGRIKRFVAELDAGLAKRIAQDERAQEA